MANKKISQLPVASTVNDDDIIAIVQNSETKQTAIRNIKGVSSGGGNVDISTLPETNALTADDLFIVNQLGTNKKVKSENIVKIVPNVNEVLKVDSENDYITIIQNGDTLKKVKISAIKGSSNLTEEFVELTGDDGLSYRLSVKNGELTSYLSEVDTAAPITPSEQAIKDYDGLMINKVFAGGDNSLAETSCSHSFIELYNLGTSPANSKTLNLNGLFLFYKKLGGAWQKFPLKGILPANHSFLIRCAFHNDPHKDITRVNVDKYDMTIPTLKLSSEGFTLLLYIGTDAPDDSNLIRVTKDPVSGAITWTNPRYVDMFAVGGKGSGQNPPHAETRFRNLLDRFTGAMREDFANSGNVNIGSNKGIKGNNEADLIPVDFSKCDITKYRPRTLSEGEWGIYVDKPQLKKSCPNLITLCYGEDGETSRSFTWQSMISEEGFLKYRKEGTLAWINIETEKQVVTHVDSEAMVHRAMVNDLTPGIYEYMAGEEGAWSDISTFEIKTYPVTGDKSIEIMWTTDEQGWTINEYNAVGTAAKFIQANETFDFHLNTGDISQNANRSFEWRSYFTHYPTNRNVCHMNTCGNNDLIDKKYSDAYAYYATYQNEQWNSVYGWDLGFTHFVSLNSNTDFTYINGAGTVGGFDTTDDFLKAQCEWLDRHLTEVAERSVKPRWVVCYMHLSPFTVIREKRLQRFITVFEKHKVDLVLCGHNHTYSRTKALKTGYDFEKSPAYNTYLKQSGATNVTLVDEFQGDGITPINRNENKAEGVVYLMSQATGYKLSGKEKPISLIGTDASGTEHDNGSNQPWWYAVGKTPPQPSYMRLSITKDTIDIKSFQINNILDKDVNGNITVNPYTVNGPKSQNKELFDSLTINYSERTK